MRLCSGKFERGMRLMQGGTGKAIAISRPMLFLAQDREMAEEAFPGDIIGIPNHGTLRVGDTLSERSDIMITGLPNRSEEHTSELPVTTATLVCRLLLETTKDL